MPSQKAFSLIEILVVIAIIGLVSFAGITSYLNFQERQKVELAAREVMVYLRGIQANAKNGNRGSGGGDCAGATPTNIASGDNRYKLDHWEARYAAGAFTSRAVCLGGAAGTGPRFDLPSGLNFLPNNTTFTFRALFGNTTATATQFIISDGNQYRYVFTLESGAFTNGCMCPTTATDATCLTHTCP